MTKQDFINRVLLIMNEAGMIDAQGNQFTGADAAQMDRYIEGSYVDAWRRCVKVMPRSWFANAIMPTTGSKHVSSKATGTGYVVLPADFYLLSSFKMTGWQKSVHEAAIENERTSNIQSNEYTRGSTIRPVCTISLKPVNGGVVQVLNYYSLPKGLSDHIIEEAIYVPVVKPLSQLSKEESANLNLSDQVIEPMAYLSASTVFTMFEKYEIAKALEQRAIEMFPGLQSVRGTTITTKQ